MRAVAGLGNPGAEYARTRHNAGWMLLDRLLQRGKSLERRDKEWAELHRIRLGADALWLIRSKTYMNGSGVGIEQACRSLQLQAKEVLVAYDDVDLPLGRLRLRPGGGAGGHRGLESVIEALATTRVARLRLGVRGARSWRDTADYVLSEFEDGELEARDEMLKQAVAAVRMILRRGIATAMNHYNQKTKPKVGSDTRAESPKEQPE